MKRVNRVEESAKVQERIDALESVAAFTAPLNEDAEDILEGMLKEYIARLGYLNCAKEYMVHFVGGGWNTCYGRDEEEAFVNAKSEHEGPGCADGCKVRSVSLATSAGKEAAMRLFY